MSVLLHSASIPKGFTRIRGRDLRRAQRWACRRRSVGRHGAAGCACRRAACRADGLTLLLKLPLPALRRCLCLRLCFRCCLLLLWVALFWCCLCTACSCCCPAPLRRCRLLLRSYRRRCLAAAAGWRHRCCAAVGWLLCRDARRKVLQLLAQLLQLLHTHRTRNKCETLEQHCDSPPPTHTPPPHTHVP